MSSAVSILEIGDGVFEVKATNGDTSLGGEEKGLLKDRGVDVIDYKVWQMIDAAEIAKGKALGKPREKFIERGTMLAAVGE